MLGEGTHSCKCVVKWPVPNHRGSFVYIISSGVELRARGRPLPTVKQVFPRSLSIASAANLARAAVAAIFERKCAGAVKLVDVVKTGVLSASATLNLLYKAPGAGEAQF